MFSRSGGTFSASIAAAAPSSRSTRLARMARCNSSNVGTARLPLSQCQKRTGMVGLAEQYVERRHVGVPFDQGRNRTEPAERFPIQCPYLRDDPRAVIVDAQGAAVVERSHAVAGEMDFPDSRGRQCGQIGRCVPAMIMRTDVDVVDV